MVDRIARDKYAELLRHFASGRLTFGEYDEQADDIAWESDDGSIGSVYSDLSSWVGHELKPIGQRLPLSKDAKRRVAHAILFLQSDEEYKWPYEWYGVADLLLILTGLCGATLVYACHEWLWGLGLIALGLTNIPRRRWWWGRKHRLFGDLEAWPFRHKGDIDEARRNPRLLNGS